MKTALEELVIELNFIADYAKIAQTFTIEDGKIKFNGNFYDVVDAKSALAYVDCIADKTTAAELCKYLEQYCSAPKKSSALKNLIDVGKKLTPSTRRDVVLVQVWAKNEAGESYLKENVSINTGDLMDLAAEYGS